MIMHIPGFAEDRRGKRQNRKEQKGKKECVRRLFFPFVLFYFATGLSSPKALNLPFYGLFKLAKATIS
jgi:hypothetical protein